MLRLIYLILLGSILTLLTIGLAHGTDNNGDIQITSQSGIKIWIDGQFVGETNSFENGLFIANVAAGGHLLKTILSGYHPKEQAVEVIGGQTAEVILQLVSLSNRVKSKGTSTTETLVKRGKDATLVFRSIPLHAKVFFDDGSLGEADLIYHPAPLGHHKIRVEYKGKVLKTTVDLGKDDEVKIIADFRKSEINVDTANQIEDKGPIDIVLRTKTAHKPARFPHRSHQDRFPCGDCHHSKDNNNRLITYYEGMEIKRCTACHNRFMQNSKLNSFRLASHTRCKECHRQMAKDGKAGPIDKCTGCHLDQTKPKRP